MKNHGHGSNNIKNDINIFTSKCKTTFLNTRLNDSQSSKIQQCCNKTSLEASQIAHGLQHFYFVIKPYVITKNDS